MTVHALGRHRPRDSGTCQGFAEYAALLEAAGFAGARATPMRKGMLIIEATAG